jgi:hypothetical protein
VDERRPFALPEPGALAEAFRWSAYRTVTKTATVSLHGNRYQVEPHLAGQKVELVFDPLSQGRDKGSYADLSVIPTNASHGRCLLLQVGIMQAAVIRVPGP